MVIISYNADDRKIKLQKIVCQDEVQLLAMAAANERDRLQY